MKKTNRKKYSTSFIWPLNNRQTKLPPNHLKFKESIKSIYDQTYPYFLHFLSHSLKSVKLIKMRETAVLQNMYNLLHFSNKIYIKRREKSRFIFT